MAPMRPLDPGQGTPLTFPKGEQDVRRSEGSPDLGRTEPKPRVEGMPRSDVMDVHAVASSGAPKGLLPHDISPAKLKELLAQGGVTLLDVRRQENHREARIEGEPQVNLPFPFLERAIRERDVKPNRFNSVKKKLPKPNTPVVVYCVDSL